MAERLGEFVKTVKSLVLLIYLCGRHVAIVVTSD